ncbi:MAG: T9SS type A sorting domain-containing protein [Bacteroidota bacterium]
MKKNYSQKLFFASLRKQFFLTLVLFVFTVGTNAQISTFPWTETFEDSSPTRASWTQIYEVNAMAWTYVGAPSTGGWVGTSTPYEGAKFANYPATSHAFDKTKLVSPVLNLTGMTNATVSFYYRNPFWDPDQNWLRVFYRTSAVAAWIQVAEFHTNIVSWTSSGNIGIPSTAYQIAIECETDYGYSTTVDALVVNAAPLAVNEFTKATISYFPNPTANLLHFSSNNMIYDVSVFTLLGQKVMETKVNSNEGQIDISNLTPGTYIVRGNTEAGTEIFKAIKK